MTPPLPHDPTEQLIADFQHALTILADNQSIPIGFATVHPTTPSIRVHFLDQCPPEEFRSRLTNSLRHAIRRQLRPVAILFLNQTDIISTWIHVASLAYTPLTADHIKSVLTELLTNREHDQPPLFHTPHSTLCLN